MLILKYYIILILNQCDFYQFIGGIVGPAFLYLGIPPAYRTPERFGANVIPEGVNGGNIFFGEVIAAFILTTVIFGHAIDKR